MLIILRAMLNNLRATLNNLRATQNIILIYVARKLYFYSWFSISRIIYLDTLSFLFRGGIGWGLR